MNLSTAPVAPVSAKLTPEHISAEERADLMEHRCRLGLILMWLESKNFNITDAQRAIYSYASEVSGGSAEGRKRMYGFWSRLKLNNPDSKTVRIHMLLLEEEMIPLGEMAAEVEMPANSNTLIIVGDENSPMS